MRVIKINSFYLWSFILNLLLVFISCGVIISSMARHGEDRDIEYAKLMLAAYNQGETTILKNFNVQRFPASPAPEFHVKESFISSKSHLESDLNTQLGNHYQVVINPQNGDGLILDRRTQQWLLIPHLTITPNSILFVILPLLAMIIFVNFCFWWKFVNPLNHINRAIIRFQKTGFPTRLPSNGIYEIDNVIRNLNIISLDTYQSNQERSLMFASILHDLKSPLTRLQLRAEFVDDDELQHGFLNDCQFMSMLIHQLSSYFHQSVFMRTDSVNHICHKIASYPEFEHAQITFDLQLPNQIKLPELELERILVNLISNACYYGKPPIICQTQLNQHDIQISVIDHGTGIAEKNWKYAQMPFVRLDKHRPTGVPHSGLGLASVKKLVNFLGGQISHSYPDGGFSIEVHIPVSASYH